MHRVRTLVEDIPPLDARKGDGVVTRADGSVWLARQLTPQEVACLPPGTVSPPPSRRPELHLMD